MALPPTPASPKPLSRRKNWMLFFWGGTTMFCLSLALLVVAVALGQADIDNPLWLLFVFVFVSGYTLRRVAKRSMRSVERGGNLEFERFGIGLAGMIERRSPVARTPDLGTAEPEPGLRRHVVIGDGILIASIAIVIVAALITLTY